MLKTLPTGHKALTFYTKTQRQSALRNPYIGCEEHIEAQTEGNNKQSANDQELQECLQDVKEHDDVDTQLGKLPNENKQITPGQEDSDNSTLPLPFPYHTAVTVAYIIDQYTEHI